jgi:hypothetical protein
MDEGRTAQSAARVPGPIQPHGLDENEDPKGSNGKPCDCADDGEHELHRDTAPSVGPLGGLSVA